MTRRLVFAFFLVLALLLGQQLAVEHALVHPAKADCDLCLEIAPLSGGAATHVPVVHGVAPDLPTVIVAADGVATVPPPAFFLSRAPPTALHA